MAGLFAGNYPLKRAFVGTNPVKSIWVGDKKVWPTFTRQRMNKAGDMTGLGTGWKKVTGWVSDIANPATVASDGLVVSGGGQATVSGTVNSDSSNTWWMGLEIRVNGKAVASVTAKASSVTFTPVTVTVTDGDRVELWCNPDAAGSRVNTGTYIDINPT